MRAVAFLAAALLVACQGKASAPIDAAVPAPAPAPLPSSTAARPDLREPRLTQLTRRPSSMVDVAPGRPASSDHPAGTVYVAAVLDTERRRGEATLFEWDVASATPLDRDGILLYRESDKEENGKSADVRIATTQSDVFVAVTLENGRFTAFGRAPLPAGASWGSLFAPEHMAPASNISLETDGRWLAVAYDIRNEWASLGGLPRTGVLLYDARTMERVASIPFTQSRETGVRYDILEMIGGRLVAAESSDTTLRVVELAMPSLKTLHEAKIPTPKGRARVQLTSQRGRLVALTHDTVVELTPELEVVGKREIHSDEVALGPAGELLTPLGLAVPGRRGDFVPDVRASASCTPAWAGGYPLLACAVDMEGIRIARLAPR
jgi:hypothetical protein